MKLKRPNYILNTFRSNSDFVDYIQILWESLPMELHGGSRVSTWGSLLSDARSGLLSQFVMEEARSFVNCTAIVCEGASEASIQVSPFYFTFREAESFLPWCLLEIFDCYRIGSGRIKVLLLGQISGHHAKASICSECWIKFVNLQLTSHHRWAEGIVRFEALQVTLHKALSVMVKDGVVWGACWLKRFGSSLDWAAMDLGISFLFFLQKIGQLLGVHRSKLFAVISHLLESPNSVDFCQVQSLRSGCVRCASSLRRASDAVRQMVLIWDLVNGNRAACYICISRYSDRRWGCLSYCLWASSLMTRLSTARLFR